MDDPGVGGLAGASFHRFASRDGEPDPVQGRENGPQIGIPCKPLIFKVLYPLGPAWFK